ncbi:MAG: lipoyl(octanoyl) transferase LipB [Tannerella sp.]|jgi:lipoyl(octanoyl) transferase|nr:lipoyl(octanoyl) transferase LipB [Tannerella sp.]
MTEFQDIGLIDYQAAWTMQEELMKDVQTGGTNRVLFVEHPHVYTLGRNGDTSNMLHQPTDTQLIKINRGGDITYHGPGQLVVYTILRIRDYGVEIREFVHGLEETVIRTISHYGINATRLAKATGVWLDPLTPAVRKICAIGLRCSQGVTMHGFALNVNTDLKYFSYINPCGFTNKGVTSIERETGEQADMDEVKKLVKQNFTQIFMKI